MGTSARYNRTAMSDAPSIPTPAPVIRFRLRTMLIATTILAVAAAPAGAYYRSAPVDGRQRLLVLWGVVALAAAASYWRRLREPYARGKDFHVRQIVYAIPYWRVGRRRIASTLYALMVIGGIPLLSYLVAQGGNAHRDGWHVIQPALGLGIAVAGVVSSFVRPPIYLCEEGIPLASRHVAPWKYIRYAEWVADRRGAMKLRRMDGDIYFDVPDDGRGEVEAFVRSKTKLVNGAAG